MRGQLPEDARHGRVHDGERERGGGYGVVGEADEWSPLTGYRRSEGRVRARGWGWQAGPTDRGRAGAGLCGPDGPKVRGGRDSGSFAFSFYFRISNPFLFIFHLLNSKLIKPQIQI